jgi:hypothetical protein
LFVPGGGGRPPGGGGGGAKVGREESAINFIRETFIVERERQIPLLKHHGIKNIVKMQAFKMLPTHPNGFA